MNSRLFAFFSCALLAVCAWLLVLCLAELRAVRAQTAQVLRVQVENVPDVRVENPHPIDVRVRQ